PMPTHRDGTPLPPTLSLHDALPILKIHFAGNLLHQRITSIEKRVPVAVPIHSKPINPHILGFFDLLPDDRRILAVVADVDVIFIDRKSTRLNSSHGSISYSVFCLI